MFVLKRRKARLLSVAFSHDGTKVAAAGDRGNVLVWDLGTKAVLADTPFGTTMKCPVAFLGGTRLAVGDGFDLFTRDIHGEGAWKKLALPSGTGWPSVSPDGSAAFRASEKAVWVYSLAGRPTLLWKKPRPRAHYFSGPHAWSPCCRFLIEPAPGGTLTLRDAPTGEPVGTFGEADTKEVTAVAVSPGGRAAAWAASTTLHIQKAGSPIVRHRLGKTHFNALAFHPSAPLLATANGDGKVDYWDADTGERRGSFAWSAARLNAIAFDAAGGRGVCCSNDGEVIIWDVDR